MLSIAHNALFSCQVASETSLATGGEAGSKEEDKKKGLWRAHLSNIN